ncbi:NADP(H)-dependent aldo-keto reductase [Halomonas elongata]|uniref:Protein tas n=1 Tax=Halomonas elongata (strain ATCC 33173 / DSM 2581 / NBRC 15536 / NCIMB 2198 / 1H9) TaxID=768066 RepID=E1V5W4_HALED|nr:NADP(H)-dependent aldo-keto reductase [Halomonas elongata]MBW5800833.1 NADP(H)-dependent aldo-keto reductase [Halomonas elongata]MDL4863379.1 NADP(H)-dependent aldo-keto reductase [Halomonas elongata]WBF18464.1 NADP(H)-dependent aldo-keto reductase [Halomonas elongata]WPU47317.1 NADP(H)-dependent aldo-keto reductase [Halomonas elongata DSM 2581]WVI71985.1 NADP(H)-dependent aldo-keto reductase [Halomonas elongata]
MHTRPLGNTGIEVSRLCLGTMTFGEQNSEAEAHEQLDRAVSFGIDFIDTAEMYPVPPDAATQGRTESYIGSWLASRGSRDDIILATKVAGPGLAHLRGGSRLTREQIHQAIDASLTRLQTDYVDLYQLHWPDRRSNFFGRLGYEPDEEEDAIALEESLSALQELVKAGKVRAVGLSNETPWGVMHALRLADRLGLPRVASVQNPYSLLNRTFEVGLAEIAHRENVGLLAYSPLGFGVLSGKYLDGARPEGARLTRYERFQRYTSPQAEQAVRAYVEIAREHDLDPAQMALAFVNSRPFLTSNIIGATTMAQLESNLASESLRLSDEVLDAIEDVHRRLPNPCP